jgi:hypothetical protein
VQQLRANFLDRYRKLCLKELMTVLPDGLLCPPPVQFLGPSIPVQNDVTHIADENGVMREIEQAGLLGSFRDFGFELVASFKKLCLDTAPNDGEPGDK